jgi:acyl-CoA synthetase (AMP-forming)/AMP-acid ligase II
MPHLITGSIVVADIVLKDKMQETLKSDIRLFCKSKLPNYKIPVKINIVEKIALSDRNKKVRNKQ